MKVHIVQHDVRTLRMEDNLDWIAKELESQDSKEALLTVLKPIPATGDHFDGTLYLAVGMIILIGLLVTQRTGKRKKTSDRS